MMNFDELFEQRSLVGTRLKDLIRDNGYTKVSFASKTDISRPTLDKLLNGSVDSKKTFDRHLRKILEVLKVSSDELLSYRSPRSKEVVAVYSKNPPINHEMSDLATEQYNLLLDLIELCAIYY